MAPPLPERVPTDHTGSPQPKPAKGVKLAVSVACGVLGVLLLAAWGLVRALE